MALYKTSETYGGQYDEARDTAERLRSLFEQKPDAILVAEDDGSIVGTVTLFEDGRSAWLYRFAVQIKNEEVISKELSQRALLILKEKGHTQVLVYAPAADPHFKDRYTTLGFIKGNDFTAYWQDI